MKKEQNWPKDVNVFMLFQLKVIDMIFEFTDIRMLKESNQWAMLSQL